MNLLNSRSCAKVAYSLVPLLGNRMIDAIGDPCFYSCPQTRIESSTPLITLAYEKTLKTLITPAFSWKNLFGTNPFSNTPCLNKPDPLKDNKGPLGITALPSFEFPSMPRYRPRCWIKDSLGAEAWRTSLFDFLLTWFELRSTQVRLASISKSTSRF